MVRFASDVGGVSLPSGVEVVVPELHSDRRGSFAEVHRASWDGGPAVVQWGLTHSGRNTLRGMHVHLQRHDFVVVVAGEMLLALHDLRVDSPTYRRSSAVVLEAVRPCGVRIPTGVAHGFYFAEPGSVLVGTSEYWDATDEFGCRWDAPEIAVEWPCSDPVLSERDSAAGSYQVLAAQVAARVA